MLKQAASFIGWAYLPDRLTGLLLHIFYVFYSRVLRRTPPAAGTPLYYQHRRAMYITAIASYLAYNFYTTTVSTPPNYYELLGVQPTANISALKTGFRQFAKRYHPDRVGPQGEATFIKVRDAYEALKDPLIRFAYDRFGPDALQWPHCTTEREYMIFGMMQSIGFHIFAFGSLIIWTIIGGSHPAQIWRYLIYFCILSLELVFILGPSPYARTTVHISPLLFYESKRPPYTRLFSMIWPHRVAWQHVRFLHNFFLFSTAAVTRLAPALMPPPLDVRRLCADIDRLTALAKVLDREVALQIHTQLHSVHGPMTNTQATDASFTYTPPCEPAEEVVALLSAEMKKMCIEVQLRKDGGPMRSAFDVAVGKRKQGAKEAKHGVLSPDPSPPPPKFPSNAITDFRTWRPPKDLPAPSPSKHAMRMAAMSEEFHRGRSRSC
ncbi:hypothetical protein CERSUDRAFT_118370 [Gelatoporia subvermispora B]|uniref:J domain-containing protein n=1 Tax=Ceriporiopsis subvermispora (strain B) TaxID=914234 RepID=M2R253_CERS8|nr:hypothetical protein CERSUDRAFT_118370 [Gelatoporia subvermispora B]